MNLVETTEFEVLRPLNVVDYLVGSLVKSGRTLELRQHSGVEVLPVDE